MYDYDKAINIVDSYIQSISNDPINFEPTYIKTTSYSIWSAKEIRKLLYLEAMKTPYFVSGILRENPYDIADEWALYLSVALRDSSPASGDIFYPAMIAAMDVADMLKGDFCEC